jgi:hypothetical protein
MTKKINLKEEQLSNLSPDLIKKAMLEVKQARQNKKEIESKWKPLLNDAKEALLLCESIEGEGFNITMKVVDKKAYEVPAKTGIKTLKLNVL